MMSDWVDKLQARRAPACSTAAEPADLAANSPVEPAKTTSSEGVMGGKGGQSAEDGGKAGSGGEMRGLVPPPQKQAGGPKSGLPPVGDLPKAGTPFSDDPEKKESQPDDQGAPSGTETTPGDPGDAPAELTDRERAEIDASLITFAEETLGMNLYGWQCKAIGPLDNLSKKLTLVTLVTPNGSGKSAVVIPAIVLGVLALYPRAKVVLTTADGKQLDNQVMPALEAHRSKFPTWKFIEREIQTPGEDGTFATGGRFVGFTTDAAGRAEGWHKIDDHDGPLVIIADEAKTIPEEIFTAIDRCTFNALVLTSSPGLMVGRFYQSHALPELGYVRVKAGLLDCPHIDDEKIARLEAQYGEKGATPNPELLKSTLHGEFMLRMGEMKFDREGLEHMEAMGKAGLGTIGRLEKSRATGSVVFMPDEHGWLWLGEERAPGRSYLMACDPNSCEQGEGTSERDNTAALILRDAYLSREGVEHKTTVAACLHWPGGVKWDSDVLARRMALACEYFGHCMAVVEANNFGSALMKDLVREGVSLWRRTKIDDVNPNKELKLNGYLSTGKSREWWVQAASAAVREQSLVCHYKAACDEFQTFIITPEGRAEAQVGFHDDWVAAIGIGLVVKCYSALVAPAAVDPWRSTWNETYNEPVSAGRYGSGALG